MMKIRVFATTLVAVILIPILSVAGDVVFIGNPSVPVSELSVYDIKSIFLGSKINWNDSSDLIFVTQKKSTCHELFLQKYINKTPSQYADYWKRQLFTGRGQAPKTMENDQEVITFVQQTKGAIGYVSTDTGLDKVKVLKIK